MLLLSLDSLSHSVSTPESPTCTEVFNTGVYKVPYSPGGGGREYHDCGEEYNVKKGKGKQYHLPYNIKAVGKNIKL